MVGVNGLEMTTAERTDLADFLADLEPEQWLVRSLCEGWRVRDVVAHVMSFDDIGLLGMLPVPSRPGLLTSTRWVLTNSHRWTPHSSSPG